MLLNHAKANQAKVVAAGLIDAALTIAFFVTLVSYFPRFPETINLHLAIFLGFILYRLFTIILFDRTLGMNVFKIFFLSGEEERLNFKEKILASVFILFEGVDYYRRLATMSQ